jgi:hypothetical protein
VSDWYIANSMRLDTSKMCVVSHARKTNFLNVYQLCCAIIIHSSSIKDLGVFFDSKFISTIMLIMYFLNVLNF